MAGGIKISKPERLPSENVSETDLHAWWNELLNYLNQEEDFAKFKANGPYSTWTAAEDNEDRVNTQKGNDTANDLPKRQRQLNNYITIIAGCCSKDQYMHIIKQATSLNWIWQELSLIYGHQHKGKDFLNIVDIEWNPPHTTPMSIYNNYRAKILENLKPAGTVLKWKNNTRLERQEALSPTFEDHILISVLNLIDKRLPAKVRETFGPRLEDGKFLMDVKTDILTNVNKMLEELDESDNKVNAIKQEDEAFQAAYVRPYKGQARGGYRGSYRGRRPNYNSQQRAEHGTNKGFCRLCHVTRQPAAVVMSHKIGDLQCPALSTRDKEDLKAQFTVAAVQQAEPTEEEMMQLMALEHGYDDVQVNENTITVSPSEGKSDHQPKSFDANNLQQTTCIHHIKPVPSQILTVHQNDIPIHLDLDSGCWISTVRMSFAQKMRWTIHPNGQLAKIADGKTVMQSRGEIHEVFNRNNWTVRYSAIVMDNLHTDLIAGNNFILDNSVKQDFAARTIMVHNKYIIPETNRNTNLSATSINSVVTLQKARLLPNQSITVPVPHPDDTMLLIESANNSGWPEAQMCTVQDNSITITNNNKTVKFNKQPVSMKQALQTSHFKPNPSYTLASETTAPESISAISANYDRLTQKQQQTLSNILENNKEVFDQDLSVGYNQFSGKHMCKLKWANNERPSSKKVHCVQYNSQLNALLQQVCDQLTADNVLGIPQQENVEVQHVMPCFLRKKQRAKDKPLSELTTKDVRLVVNTCELSKYMKSLPAKVCKPQDVYNRLGNWKYIVKTDLFQGFFQNHLHPEAMQWCAVLTPFGGLRFFKRGIQGLINQTEELDELLAKLFNKMLTEGRLVKQADDLLTGGNTIEEALENLSEMLVICKNNNIKLSPSKTFIFPKTVDILSWLWSEGGTLAPSPHRKQTLAQTKEDDLATIKDLRSWVGLYKTFLYHTPNLTNILDPFDKITGGKDSKDDIIWTPELSLAFQRAKEHVDKIKEVYLPSPDDQLIVSTDGARTPPGIGFVLQAKDKEGNTRVVRHYSVKLKEHHLKWYPCEIEAVAFGTAIEAFYDIIKESKHPVIICPDSKPVCDAVKLLQQGKFSLSPRIQTFLNQVGKVRADIQHVAGTLNQAADYKSRNTQQCNAEICQLCNYVQHQADTIIDTRIGAMQDTIPYSNRNGWRDVQEQDKACIIAKKALLTGQLVSKKPGKVTADARKLVNNAKVATDGLLYVPRTIPYSTIKEERYVVPTSLIKTILVQLHNKNNHPSKSQLKNIFDKYFYSPGMSSSLEEIYDTCMLCNAAKKLPVQTVHKSSTIAQKPGTHMSCDIMRRAKQKIIVMRDQFSSYTVAKFIQAENHNDIQEAIIELSTPIRSKDTLTIRTDKATAFQKLKTTGTLEALDINIDLAHDFNKNANAVIDKGIQELENEIVKIVPTETQLSTQQLAMAIQHLNNRLRRSGKLSAREILFGRDDNTGENLHLNDSKLIENQKDTRERANDRHNENISQSSKEKLAKGDTVMLKANPKKHQLRDTFVVEATAGEKVIMKRALNAFSNKPVKIRNKPYTVTKDMIFKPNASLKHGVTASTKKKQLPEYDPVARNDDSSDYESESGLEEDTTENEHDADHILPNNSDKDDSFHSVQDTHETEHTPQHSHQITPAKRKIKEVWITNHQAAITIQKWFRKHRANRPRSRQAKIQAKINIAKMNTGTRSRTPEISRNLPGISEFLLTTEEEDRDEDTDTESCEWDNLHECTSPTFSASTSPTEHEKAFHTQPLNLQYTDQAVDLHRVYNYDQYLQSQLELAEAEACLQGARTSTPIPQETKNKKDKKKLKLFGCKFKF